ncbi:hypothetical protein [Clostridium butyricum]|uniref:hypothetical protein n=1 Tax=Clostridium butyricum TaxID=1492 RepID=UPI002AB05B5F|nr:hypothetical protein [Clostridium butyricum]
MTLQEFVEKLYTELQQNQDAKHVANEIQSVKKNNKLLSINEQLEIVNLIRDIHHEKTKGLFESVEGFLSLVNAVETEIKMQNTSSSKNGGSSNNNANK